MASVIGIMISRQRYTKIVRNGTDMEKGIETMDPRLFILMGENCGTIMVGFYIVIRQCEHNFYIRLSTSLLYKGDIFEFFHYCQIIRALMSLLTTINDLPLDCIRLIALIDIPTYRAMLMIKQFALTTLDPNVNKYYRASLTVRYEWYFYGSKYIAYKLNNMTHREDDLPAVIWANGCEEWHKFGRTHRDDDKPAITWPNGEMSWYVRGILHRNNGKPARIRSNGYQEWYVLGQSVGEDYYLPKSGSESESD
jgi:hypothetical protein